MRIERDKGKMTAPRLRLYHSMYQLFSFTMLLALTTNNMGLLWVAMEAATLSTVWAKSGASGSPPQQLPKGLPREPGQQHHRRR